MDKECAQHKYVDAGNVGCYVSHLGLRREWLMGCCMGHLRHNLN